MNRGGRPDEIRFGLLTVIAAAAGAGRRRCFSGCQGQRADRVDRPVSERPGVQGSCTCSATNSESPVRSASSMTDTRLCLSNTADPDGGHICDELRPKCVPKTSDYTTAALVLC